MTNEVKSSAALAEGGDRTDPTRYNTRMQELTRIDKLSESSWQMTDLRDEEIIAFSIYRSLHLGMCYRVKENGRDLIAGGLPQFMDMIESIRDMRPSRNRLSRREFIDAIGKGRPMSPWELPPGFKQDEEMDQPKWWQFWRKK